MEKDYWVSLLLKSFRIVVLVFIYPYMVHTVLISLQSCHARATNSPEFKQTPEQAAAWPLAHLHEPLTSSPAQGFHSKIQQGAPVPEGSVARFTKASRTDRPTEILRFLVYI